MAEQFQPPFFHIGLETSSLVTKDVPLEFMDIIACEGLHIIEKRRTHTEMYAASEWFIPAAIMVYIAKPYFESFLSEMGKHHYQLLKKGLVCLVEKSVLSNAKIVASGTQKLPSGKKYSVGMSILVQADQLGTIKFLLEEGMDVSDAAVTVDRITSFAMAINENSLSEAFTSQMGNLRTFGELILISYDPKNDEFVVLDAHPNADPKNFPRFNGKNLKQ